MPRSFTQRARDAYADEFDKMGPAYRNTASSLRAGFENMWIAPAIRALEAVLRMAPDEDDPDEARSA